MEIQQSANYAHWNYYIALEQDLAKASRYIEFTESNFPVFSIELAHLLLATSSEVDVVLKALCNIIKPEKNHKNIDDYKNTIKDKLPSLINEVCYIPRYGLELNPWSNWNDENNPTWWRSHTNVKHHRDIHFNQANLKNTLNSMAALNIVILYYYHKVFQQEGEELQFKHVTNKLKPDSSLIRFSDEYYYSIMAWG